MGLEETLMYLGRWGRYQMITYLFIAICMNFPTAWQLYGIVFEGKKKTKPLKKII